MTEAHRRRPVPAIVCLIALTLLTALVWWRVLNRDEGSGAAAGCTPADRNVLPRPDTIDLIVLNSTGKPGLAKGAAAALRKQGFTVTSVGNDTGHKAIQNIGEIRFSPDQQAAATLLGYFFPGATSLPLTAAKPDRLIISLGKTFKTLRSLASVQAALAKDHRSIAAKSLTGAPVTNTCAPSP